jgi:hypothetical protein
MCIRDHSRLRTDKEKRSRSGCTAKRIAPAGNPVSAGWCGQPSPAIAAKVRLRFCDGNRMKKRGQHGRQRPGCNRSMTASPDGRAKSRKWSQMSCNRKADRSSRLPRDRTHRSRPIWQIGTEHPHLPCDTAPLEERFKRQSTMALLPEFRVARRPAAGPIDAL